MGKPRAISAEQVRLRAITIERVTGGGRYGDVLDAAGWLAEHQCGSAVNAIAVMVRQSPLYAEALARTRATNNKGNKRKAS